MPAFGGLDMQLIQTANEHVLGFVRQYEGSLVAILANFSERSQSIEGNHLRTFGLGRYFEDAITGNTIGTSDEIRLEPYQLSWLQRV